MYENKGGGKECAIYRRLSITNLTRKLYGKIIKNTIEGIWVNAEESVFRDFMLVVHVQITSFVYSRLLK